MRDEHLIHRAQAVVDGKEPHDGAAIAALLEDEIERRGLWWQYTDALLIVLFGDDVIYDWANKDFWRIIRATPEQRALAFLEAVSHA